MKIEKVALIGLGSMGVFFAPRLETGLGKDHFCVIADRDRKKRLETSGVTINGENYKFPVCDPKDGKEMDLIIMAVKDMDLTQALEDIKNFVGKETQILCVMNGIESEERVAAIYGWEHVLYSYMRMSIALENGQAEFDPYAGKLYFGEEKNEELSQRVLKVKELMERCDIPYTISFDMKKGIWHKFMCNVGENMTCALLGIPFGAFQKSDHANEIRVAGMKEVQQLAKKYDVILTDEEVEKQRDALKKIPFFNRPSTLQDLQKKKKTEVDLFAGTVVRLGKKHGVSTPISWMFYHSICVLEEKNKGLFENV